jgi:hypothetical protein
VFEISSDWFSPGFEPHGHCFVDPLLWLYVASGSWIAFSLSYDTHRSGYLCTQQTRSCILLDVFNVQRFHLRLRHHASFGNMEAPKEPVYWLDRSVKAGNCGSVVRDCGNVMAFFASVSAC